MSKRPSISKAETEIARIVWQLKSCTAREVHDALPPTKTIDFSTVQTYLTRLEDKGYIKSKRNGRTKVFSARANPTTVIREKLHELRELLFDGDAVPMMRHLIEGSEMTPDDVESLKEMLDQLEER